MAARRRVFLISNTRLTAYHRNGSELIAADSFNADETGFVQFAHYLERDPGAAASIIVDVVEEEFREETVPHVFGRDRRALLHNKAVRLFRDTGYIHAMVQGRVAEGRRDDRVLFSAITRPDVMTPWLASIERCATPLIGIYSSAILTATILRTLEVADKHVLIVSLQSGGGLRQTYFQRGRLKLSRLAVPSVVAAPRRGSDLIAEIEETRRYLGNLHQAADDNPLTISVLGHGELLDDLQRAAGSDRSQAYDLIDLHRVARTLGMPQWGGEPTADRLFVHVLMRRPTRNHYATPREMRGFATRRVRTYSRVASVLLMAGGALFGGAWFLEGMVATGQARTLELHARIYEDRYQAAQAQLPAVPAAPSELERVVSAIDALRTRRGDPMELLARISDGLSAFPRVRIERISWSMRNPARIPPDDQGDRGRDAIDARNPSPPADGESGLGSQVTFQVALIGARIAPFDGDYRAAINLINRFAAVLAAPDGAQARVLGLPLDLSAQQTLTGNIDNVIAVAEFEIELAVRVIPATGRRSEPVTYRGFTRRARAVAESAGVSRG